MAGNVLEEVLRIVLETQGKEGLDALRKALTEIGDVSDQTVADVNKLANELTELNAAAGKAARMEQLAGDLARTGGEMNAAATAAYQFGVNLQGLSRRSEELQSAHAKAKAEVERLGAAMKQEGANTKELGAAHKSAQAEVKRLGDELRDNDKQIKSLGAAQKSARAEVEKLEGAYEKQASALDKLDKELSDSGRDTKDLAKLQDTLGKEAATATSAIEKQAKAIQSESQAAAALKQRLQDGDDAFRKFAQAGTASAEALKRYRDGADGAAAGTRNLADQGGRLTSMFSGLRSLIAPVLAYLSFDAAKQGIANLIGVGAAAENARRSLQNLYGGVEEGNRAYEGLRNMAKSSGLAFADLVEDAKKLKAFGLDPLNGSLQALIDQNAAVGGSQQDLSGKVLALGQAWAKQKLQGEEILQLVERGVPVWDLLQKATGKNVAELQKLSSAGALGRDVIQKLYEEIGKQNAGAAAEALFSLSGGIQQLAARWDDFLQRVADSGVTDYFKKQIQSLLGGTLDIDKMAKRVADGVIGMLEAIRTLGAQLAPIGAAVGSLTLFLAEHAKAVLGIVKAWALFRTVEIIAGFAGITGAAKKATAAVVAETAATTANTAAKEANAAAGAASAAATATAATASARAAAATAASATGLTGAFQALGERIVNVATAAVRMVRGLGIPAVVIGSVYALTKAYEGVVEANNNLWLSEAQLKSQQQDQLKLGQQLQAMYRESAAVAIQSGDAVSKMTRDQANDYKFALEQARLYYRGVINEAVATGDAVKLAGAREKMEELGQAIDGVREQLEELKKAADPRGLQAFADAAVTKFDELVTKSKDAKTAISGIFDGIDLRTADGIKQASDILTQIAARGTEAGRAVRTELGAAISKVAIEDFPKLKAQADAAMAAGVNGAKEFSKAVSEVGLRRLGVDIEAIKTGMTETGRAAVSAFKVAVSEIDNLGLTVEQKSKAIAQAFDNAFKQASTKAELEALKAALLDALNSGDIQFVEFRKRIDEADAKLAELRKTSDGLGDSDGPDRLKGKLNGIGGAASGAASSLDKAAAATKGANKESKAGEGILASFALAWDGMNDSALRAMTSMNKYLVNGLTATHSLQYRLGIERLTAEMQRQLKTVRDLVAATEAQNAVYDENEQRLIALRQQYKYLADAELQRLIDAENELKQNQERAADEAQRKAEETAAAYREQAAAAEEAAKAAAESGSALTQRSGQSAQDTASAATQVLDSAAAAADSISRAATSVASAEVTLRVIAEPNPSGQSIVLSTAQLQDLASMVLRVINQSRQSST